MRVGPFWLFRGLGSTGHLIHSVHRGHRIFKSILTTAVWLRQGRQLLVQACRKVGEKVDLLHLDRVNKVHVKKSDSNSGLESGRVIASAEKKLFKFWTPILQANRKCGEQVPQIGQANRKCEKKTCFLDSDRAGYS